MGSRLKSRTGDLPKPMTLINGVPVLEHQINLCYKNGFTKIALLVHYQYRMIKEYFGDGAKFGVELVYVVEHEARGTAGALLDALDVMGSRFLVLYGDTYADINLKMFWDFDSRRKSAGTLFLHPNDHPQDSDLMEVGDDGALIRVHSYPHPEGVDYQNLVNAALYILDKESLINVIPVDRKTDLAKNTFPALLDVGKILYGYVTPEYIKDMGTPERLDKVERDINQGLPENLSGRNPRTAVFLDRDGTLNLEVNHLNAPDKLKLLDGSAEAIKRINRAGILAIGVTNQPVLARGDVSPEGLKKIHARLDRLLGEKGAYLDRMYVCPHHPDKGFPGEIPELKMECLCRKPQTGLFDLAVQELNISRRDSWMVGDTTADILAGKRAGLSTILVRTGFSGRDYKYDVEPDFVANDLVGAIEWVLHGHTNAVSKLMPLVSCAANSRVILIGGASRSGKSSIANVLAELLSLIGKKSHVLPLDGWLKPAEERQEGAGVLGRYRLEVLIEQARRVALSPVRFDIEYTEYDRKLKQVQKSKKASIGPSDIVIFEGVPAILDKRLLDLANLSIHVDVDDALRMKRLHEEYLWREERQDDFMKKIMSREIDEVSLIKSAAHKADYQINF
ncbi:HAD-IIIA family hydrolase [Polynucleobacter sp. MWH-Jannik1A5]|nr:HAD-IIIA family hydrolase [Polynucleobacter sp. MWH-Jannik1A5]